MLTGNPQSLSTQYCTKCDHAFAAGPELECKFDRREYVETMPNGRMTTVPQRVSVTGAQQYQGDQCVANCYRSCGELQNHKNESRRAWIPELGVKRSEDPALKSTSAPGTPFAGSPINGANRPTTSVNRSGNGNGHTNWTSFLHIGSDEAPVIGEEATHAKIGPLNPTQSPLASMVPRITDGTKILGTTLPLALAKETLSALGILGANGRDPPGMPGLNSAGDDASGCGSGPPQVSPFSDAHLSRARSVADAAMSKYGFVLSENNIFKTTHPSTLSSNNSHSSGSSIYLSAKSHSSNFSQLEDSSRSSRLSTHLSATSRDTTTNTIKLSTPRSEFRKLIEARGLRRDVDNELNWSGKSAGSGQHAEFNRGDKIPLERVGDIGQSLTAKVEKVRCKRIMLARKTMRCTRRWTLLDAINEVEHLERIRHFHIVQLVGTYIVGREFSILLYPAANWNLKTFMDEVELDLESPNLTRSIEDRRCLAERLQFLMRSFQCLIAALAVVHASPTKHMDIKPLNILVKQARGDDADGNQHQYRIYIADFGISRTFSPQDHSQTAGPTSRSPMYCAPEVFNGDLRGRAADIFSMGCVFLEMATVLRGLRREDFAEFRGAGNNEGDESFRENLSRVARWSNERLSPYPALGDCALSRTYDADVREKLPIFLAMASEHPGERPTAAALGRVFGAAGCCQSGPEPFEIEEEG